MQCSLAAGAQGSRDPLEASGAEVAGHDDAGVLVGRRAVSVHAADEVAGRGGRRAPDAEVGSIRRDRLPYAVLAHRFRCHRGAFCRAQRQVLDGEEGDSGVLADLLDLVLVRRWVRDEQAGGGGRIGAQEGADRTVAAENEESAPFGVVRLGLPERGQGQAAGAVIQATSRGWKGPTPVATMTRRR